MKRNESILVYGVTGLLLVILIVAVAFGGEGTTPTGADAAGGPAPTTANRTAVTSDLEELLNLDPVRTAEPKTGAENGESGAGATPPVKAADASLDPSAAPSPADASAKPMTAVADSVRVGDYRQVTVKSGDTLSGLVQRWCGSTDAMPLAQALNEDLDPKRLPPGRAILMPWVDDEVLAKAREQRAASAAPTGPVAAAPQDGPATSPARVDGATGQPTGHTYKVKNGDSLWKLAVLATGGERGAPSYIEKVLAMNPDLTPERLRVGQEIVLP